VAIGTVYMTLARLGPEDDLLVRRRPRGIAEDGAGSTI
jgi:hypothetical protein